MNVEETRMFYSWEEVMRRDNVFWNKGFRWGCLTGFALAWSIILLIGFVIGD